MKHLIFVALAVNLACCKSPEPAATDVVDVASDDVVDVVDVAADVSAVDAAVVATPADATSTEQ